VKEWHSQDDPLNESLDGFLIWFWISAALALVFIALLWFVTRRRELWLRYVALEAAFWRRVRVPERIVETSRRFEVSRVFVGFLWFIVVLWFLLAAGNGGAYVYFKSRIPPLGGPDIRVIEAPAQPPR
jgi:hypothetical protein